MYSIIAVNLDVGMCPADCKLINKDLFIVAADVVTIYPNSNRNKLRNALTSLNSQSKFCALG